MAPSYATGKTVSTSYATSTKTGRVTVSNLNVRSGASTKYRKIGSLSYNKRVTIVKTLKEWYKIKYNSGYGYVNRAYISTSSRDSKDLDGFLFVGDSFTNNIRKNINSNAKNTVIRAKGSVTAKYWINHFGQMPANSSKIKGVILQIGINDIGERYNISNTKTLIKKLSKKYSNKTIYVHRLFPIGTKYKFGNKYTTQKQIKSYNASIKSYCSTLKNVKYIDATSGFINSNGYLKYQDPEGLHISWQYLGKYYNNIEAAVNRVR
jgi:uncharacterized protein YgiM (DUF1202 family)